MAFWIPAPGVDPLLRQQLVGFGGITLAAGETGIVRITLPKAETLATVTEDGDRLLWPGTYTLSFSRGHGATVNATVIIHSNTTETDTTQSKDGSQPSVLSRFPSPWLHA